MLHKTVKFLSSNRECFEYEELTRNGEHLEVMFTKCEVSSLWKREHVVPAGMDYWWSVECFFTKNGKCYKAYNPTIIVSGSMDERGTMHYQPQLNCDWVLDATESNLYKILDDIESVCFE